MLVKQVAFPSRDLLYNLIDIYWAPTPAWFLFLGLQSWGQTGEIDRGHRANRLGETE